MALRPFQQPCPHSITTAPNAVPFPSFVTTSVFRVSRHSHIQTKSFPLTSFVHLQTSQVRTGLPSKRPHSPLNLPTACNPVPHSSDSTTQLTPNPFTAIRKILASLSFLGVLETCYLTFNKLFSSPGAICATQGCLDVLTGPFSSFLGVPLSLYGTVAYAAFLYLSIYPFSAHAEQDADGITIRSRHQVAHARDAATRPLMLALATALFTYSVFLMGLLVFVIHSMCPYCVVSATLSTLIFVLTAFVGRAVPNLKDALRVGALSTALTATLAAVVFFVGLPLQIRAQPPGGPQAPPEITMKSSNDTMRIAVKLGEKKTKMYGAYWCSHCYDQKQRFGKKAFAKIEYVECDKHGVDSKYQLCRDKRIPGYPTWEINGELYPGEIDLPELERLVDESGK